MLVEFSGNHLVCGTHDEIRLLRGEFAKVAVGKGTGLLELSQRTDQLTGLGVVADIEVDQGTGRLGSVIPVMGHGDSPHGVGFGAMCGRIGVGLWMAHGKIGARTMMRKRGKRKQGGNCSGCLDTDITDLACGRRDEDERRTTADRAVLDHFHSAGNSRLDLDRKRLPALGTLDQDLLQPVHAGQGSLRESKREARSEEHHPRGAPIRRPGASPHGRRE